MLPQARVHLPPERRKHPIGTAAAGGDAIGSTQQAAVADFDLERCGEAGSYPLIPRAARRLHPGVERQRRRAGFCLQFAQNVQRFALPDDESRADSGQFLRQGRE